MAKVKVNPGICGLSTTITASSEDGQMATVEITSECPLVMAYAAEIKELDAFAECFSHFEGSEVYSAAQRSKMHTACPVPCGIIKCIEVECSLALPKNVIMEIEK